VDQRAEQIAACLRSAGFSCVTDPAVMRLKYSKLLMNTGNAVQALLGAGLGSGLARVLREEGREVLDAAGVVYMEPDELAEMCAARRSPARPIDGLVRPGGSSWQSLTRGVGSIETGQLNGAICRLGREHGVATPANDAVLNAAMRAAAAGAMPGAIDERTLLAAIDEARLQYQ
jgi:2-dehydropantoate 2-reductase